MTEVAHESRDAIAPQAGSSARARLRARTRILVSPFTMTTNPYIDMHKALLSDIGYDVEALSVQNLFRGAFLHLFDPKNVVVIHWLELRPFKRKDARVLLSWKGCFVFGFYSLLIALGRAKVVYFVHDHAVHDTTGILRKVSVGLIGFMRRLADFRVVHAPTLQGRYRAQYLPHPLYWDVPGHATPSRPKSGGKPVFGVLGTIRPYKDIESVLKCWPAECTLEIAGNGSADYVDTLREIVRRRSLDRAVTIDARFLSDREFEEKIVATDVLILPHQADSMLVSGAFFEAIGRVPVLISRATPFMEWAAKRFDNVLLFHRIEELADIVASVAQTWPAIASAAQVAGITDEFGWSACRRQYQRFFDEVLGRR